MIPVDALIQARTTSTRLPGKVLMELGGKTVVQHIIDAALKAFSIRDVWVVIPTHDITLAKHILDTRPEVKIFAGEENDVLDRYYQCAKENKINHICRLTADCPAMTPEIIDEVVGAYIQNPCDYCSNIIRRTYPDGWDCEVFPFETLEEAWRNGAGQDREHVTTYMREPIGIKTHSVELPYNLSDIKLSLDTVDDLKRLRKYFEGAK